jgi:hypothetical protein
MLKTTKDINMKLGILIYLDKAQLLDREHNSESYIFKVLSPFNKDFFCGQNWLWIVIAFNRRALALSLYCGDWLIFWCS